MMNFAAETAALARKEKQQAAAHEKREKEEAAAKLAARKKKRLAKEMADRKTAALEARASAAREMAAELRLEHGSPTQESEETAAYLSLNCHFLPLFTKNRCILKDFG